MAATSQSIFNQQWQFPIFLKMSVETTLNVASAETTESLSKEIEVLKSKLEEERQKLNDVQCKSMQTNFLTAAPKLFSTF